MGHYDAAQICVNGHVVNVFFHTNPNNNSNHCSRCGSGTISACTHCKTPIRGQYVSDLPILPGRLNSPAFCGHCGKPYPWTETRLQAARDLADELDELNPIEREKLKDTLNDLVQDGPKTELATIRFKKIAQKLRKVSVEAIKTVLTDIVSETAKKALFGA